MEIFRDVFPDSHPQLKYLVWFLLDFIFNDYFIGNSHTRNVLLFFLILEPPQEYHSLKSLSHNWYLTERTPSFTDIPPHVIIFFN